MIYISFENLLKILPEKEENIKKSKKGRKHQSYYGSMPKTVEKYGTCVLTRKKGYFANIRSLGA